MPSLLWYTTLIGSPLAANAPSEANAISAARSHFSMLPPSGDGRFIRALVAVVVGPGDLDLVARLAAREAKRQERVLRHRRAPFGREHGLAVVRRRHVLDEPRGDHRTLRVLALARLHLMG